VGEYDLNCIGSVKRSFMINKEFLDAKLFYRVEPVMAKLFAKTNSIGVDLFSKVKLMMLIFFFFLTEFMRAELFFKTEPMRAWACPEHVALARVSLGIREGFLRLLNFNLSVIKVIKTEAP
jgi:hypothetical protein